MIRPVTVSSVADALVTLALVAPKYTVLFPGVVLKSVPVIVTDAPAAPEVGVKDVIDGCTALVVKRHAVVDEIASDLFDESELLVNAPAGIST